MISTQHQAPRGIALGCYQAAYKLHCIAEISDHATFKARYNTFQKWSYILMMTSSNGNIFRVTGPLCGEVTGHRWMPLTKVSDIELWCFRWINGWVNNRKAGDLRRHRAYYDVTVVCTGIGTTFRKCASVFRYVTLYSSIVRGTGLDCNFSMEILNKLHPSLQFQLNRTAHHTHYSILWSHISARKKESVRQSNTNYSFESACQNCNGN